MTEPQDSMLDECHRIEEDAEHSSKGHFVASETWGFVHYAIGVPAALLATWAGHEAFTNDAQLAGIIAVLSASFVAVLTFLDPAGKKQMHLASGNQYNILQKRARIFRLVMSDRYEDELRVEEFKKLCSEREQLNLTSPQIPWYAYQLAKRRINRGQTQHRIDSVS